MEEFHRRLEIEAKKPTVQHQKQITKLDLNKALKEQKQLKHKFSSPGKFIFSFLI